MARARVLERRGGTHRLQHSRTFRSNSALFCDLQDDTRVVQCDAPAEDRCRGVNNTEAAPRITDSCKDPQDPASCYADFVANGCGQAYYAGRSPLIADPISLGVLSDCFYLALTFRYRMQCMRGWVLQEGKGLCPLQPGAAAHHVSPFGALPHCVRSRAGDLRTIGVAIFLALFNVFVFFVDTDIVMAVWDVVSESGRCNAR